MKVKNFTLRFIQIAWVAETIAVIIYSMVVIIFLSVDRVGLWIQLLPLITGLIVAQGTAAGIGPLMSEKIKKTNEGRATTYEPN